MGSNGSFRSSGSQPTDTDQRKLVTDEQRPRALAQFPGNFVPQKGQEAMNAFGVTGVASLGWTILARMKDTKDDAELETLNKDVCETLEWLKMNKILDRQSECFMRAAAVMPEQDNNYLPPSLQAVQPASPHATPQQNRHASRQRSGNSHQHQNSWTDVGLRNPGKRTTIDSNPRRRSCRFVDAVVPAEEPVSDDNCDCVNSFGRSDNGMTWISTPYGGEQRVWQDADADAKHRRCSAPNSPVPWPWGEQDTRSDWNSGSSPGQWSYEQLDAWGIPDRTSWWCDQAADSRKPRDAHRDRHFSWDSNTTEANGGWATGARSGGWAWWPAPDW